MNLSQLQYFKVLAQEETLYKGGTDAVDYAAVFKSCNLTA